MAALRRLYEYIVELTRRLDEDVGGGYGLSRWGDQMKLLHALQLHSQALIDMVLRLSSLLGHPPATPLDAARYLREKGLLDEDDFTFFRGLLGFRNMVVHGYVDVDLELVDAILGGTLYRRVLLLAEKLYGRAEKAGLDP